MLFLVIKLLLLKDTNLIELNIGLPVALIVVLI